MGRVVKNPKASSEAYVVAPPHAGGSLNGKAEGEDESYEQTLTLVEVESVSLPTQARAIDWPALHREAAEIIDTASASAEALIAEAHEHVKTFVETARTGAVGVTEKAHNDGRVAGHREGIEAAEREMDEMLATMRGLIDMARVERHKIVEGAEGEIVKLAMGIAEQILHKAVELDREIVIAIAKAAITQLVDRESITVRVNPIDLERMKEHRDSVLALGDTKHMRVIEDQRVGPGGVVVETDSGTLDAKVSTQVEEAKRVLHLDVGETIVESSPDSPLRVPNGAGSATALKTAP